MRLCALLNILVRLFFLVVTDFSDFVTFTKFGRRMSFRRLKF
jgi:hypothetical protein